MCSGGFYPTLPYEGHRGETRKLCTYIGDFVNEWDERQPANFRIFKTCRAEFIWRINHDHDHNDDDTPSTTTTYFHFLFLLNTEKARAAYDAIWGH